MNVIFIYLFFETVGAQCFNGAVGVFVKGGLGLVGIVGPLALVASA